MDKLDFFTLNKNLKERGFDYLSSIISENMIFKFKEEINECLQEFIHFHACSEQQYFSTVNRWPLESLINEKLQKMLVDHLAPIVSQIYEFELYPYEIDVLCKSIFANLGTPCHQDIAYAYKKPYQVSTWMALTNVTDKDSPLQLLPVSHRMPISPAVDFWQPEFIDGFRQKEKWQKAVSILGKEGDCVIFSSRLWHGSLPHQSLCPRLTIVIRWGNEKIPTEEIPLPKPANFGMWNCGEFTESLLKQGLKVIYNLCEDDFLNAIKIWQKKLTHDQIPFKSDILNALKALDKLHLLNEAYKKYRGSDGQGIVYSSLLRS